MEKDIILIGGGGHCKSCIDVIEQEGKYKIRGIIDKPENLYKKVLSYEITGNDDNIEFLSKNCKYFFISIGYVRINSLRKELFNKVKALGGALSSISISSCIYIKTFIY